MKRREDCHTERAHALYFSQRSRIDLQLSTDYHCTRVTDPTEQDWSKFKHLSGCLWETRFIPLIISIDAKGDVATFIDGTHAVHNDRKAHSGIFLTMGKRDVMTVTNKLGVVTSSSTDTEIVDDKERFPKFSWFRCFRLLKGNSSEEDTLTRDNESNMLLRKHHPFSEGKGSKHMNVRYFFVVDKIHQREVKIVHFPTEKIVADFSGKVLQDNVSMCKRNAK